MYVHICVQLCTPMSTWGGKKCQYLPLSFSSYLFNRVSPWTWSLSFLSSSWSWRTPLTLSSSLFKLWLQACTGCFLTYVPESVHQDLSASVIVAPDASLPASGSELQCHSCRASALDGSAVRLGPSVLDFDEVRKWLIAFISFENADLAKFTWFKVFLLKALIRKAEILDRWLNS